MIRKHNQVNFGGPFLFCLAFLFMTSCKDNIGIFQPEEPQKSRKDFKNIETVLEYFADSETVKGHFIVNPGFQLGDLIIESLGSNVILDFFSDDVKIHPDCLEFSTYHSTLDEFKKSYPKGAYMFSSWRAVNSQTKSIYKLSFEFTQPPDIMHPPAKYLLSNVEDLILKWKGFDKTQAYIVRIFENGMLIYFSKLKNTESEVVLPNSYFKNNKKYKVRLSAVNNKGNLTTSSLNFNTIENQKLKKTYN